MGDGDAAPARLTLSGIVKRFPGCLANDAISLSVAPGEIHALLGENGAGKSTLVNIIYGVLQADAGDIAIDGVSTVIDNPARARALGIGMVFQHFSLFDALTVSANIALGAGVADGARLRRRIDAVADRYGLPLQPDRAVQRLSAGEKQRLEIVRCLLSEPRLLIMDEPTSVLTPQEAQTLFVTLRRLAAEGCSILYISHKLDEVRTLCDRATVLRGGRVVAVCDPRQRSAADLARLMIGAELREPGRPAAATGRDRLVVERLSCEDAAGGVGLHEVSFGVAGGEIVGIAGVAGNGQAALLAALSGESVGDAEQLRLDGRPVGHLGPRRRRRLGLCAVPEQRLGHAAVGAFSLADNALLTGYSRLPLSRFGLLSGGRAAAFARRVIDRFDVRGGGPRAPARSLSGGNLQKFIVGREIAQRPDVLVIEQPTWGVDAGAAVAIHEALAALAGAGAAVLLISQDLDELLGLCHRVGALCAGRLETPRPLHPDSRAEVGLMMTGAAS